MQLFSSEETTSLTHDKICNMQKLKAFKDNSSDVLQMMISHFGKIEIIVGRGENAGYQHFHLFVAFVKENATMSSIPYFANHVSYFVQNQRK